MCECIAQLRTADVYLSHLHQAPVQTAVSVEDTTAVETGFASGLIPDLRDRDHVIRPNQKLTAVINRGAGLQTLQIRWGWSPIWSMGTRPPLTHLPLDIVMRSKVFERMRDSGRALVAVDGWFEAEDKVTHSGQRYAHFMRPRQKGPIYLGALAQISDSPSGCNGLVLVTHGGGGAAGPLQLLAFTPENAARWLDPELSWQQARKLASMKVLCNQEFEQVAVSQRFARKNS